MALEPQLARLESQETNPFRGSPPEVLQELSETLYDFLREQAEILRQQHNRAQAGDSTFNWEIITYLTNAQDFALGSRGRFVHPTYGMIHAVYVVLGDMAHAYGSPVGMVRGSTIPWQVTDILEDSDSDLALGVGAWRDTPRKGQFGWVIYNGVNVNHLAISSDAEVFSKFAWSDSGEVSATVEEWPIGVILTQPEGGMIPAAGALIRCEVANGLVNRNIFSAVGQLSGRVDALDSDIENLRLELGLVSGRADGIDEKVVRLNLALERQGQVLSESSRLLEQSFYAALERESLVRFTDVSAIASTVESLTARVVTIDNLASALGEWAKVEVDAKIQEASYASATALQAVANKTLLLEAQFNAVDISGGLVAVNARIDDEITTRASEDLALSNRITTIEASYVTAGAVNSAISAAVGFEASARASADTAISNRLDIVEANYVNSAFVTTTVNAAVSSEATARASGDSALSSRLDVVEANYVNAGYVTTTVNAAVSSEASARASADSALSARATSLESTVFLSSTDSNLALKARIAAEESARASQDATIASNVTTLSTTVGSLSATVTTQGTSINGILAKYGVDLNVNGHVTGFRQINDGSTGQFIIVADRFAIVQPSDPGAISPIFEVVGGETRIKNLVIGNANVIDNNIATNAIVVPAGYAQTGAYTIPQNSWGTVTLGGFAAEVTLNNTLDEVATVFIQVYTATAQAENNSDAVDYRLNRSGVGIHPFVYNNLDVSGGSARPNAIAIGWLDTIPANTSRTFTLQCNSSDNGTVIYHCVIQAQMFKNTA